jgi:hypothetical protein
MGGGYKKYDTVKVNGRNRIRFVKANSKSKNPILYIKSDNEYITYKSFLRKRKIRGGAIKEKDVTNSTHVEMRKLLYGKKNLEITIKIKDDDATEHKINAGLIKYVMDSSWSENDVLKDVVYNLEIIPADINNNISSIILTYEEEGEKDETGNPTSFKSRFTSVVNNCWNKINCTSIKEDDVRTPL